MNKKFLFILIGVTILGVILGIIFNSPQEESFEIRPRPQPFISELDFARIEQLIDQRDYKEAKELLQEKKDNLNDARAIKQVQDKIYDVNMKMLLSSYQDECSQIYTVKSGDALSRIARNFNTTVGLLKRANNLSSDRIVPGQKLKVNTCDFSVVVDKSQNKLFLRRGGEIFNAYTVATGKDGNTPEGTFKIVNKLVDPTWYRAGAVVMPDDPENILGTRWMGFDKAGYGIHGTTEPETLGQQVTLGCVRMANQEVEELYDILPTGTEVVVLE